MADEQHVFCEGCKAVSQNLMTYQTEQVSEDVHCFPLRAESSADAGEINDATDESDQGSEDSTVSLHYFEWKVRLSHIIKGARSRCRLCQSVCKRIFCGDDGKISVKAATAKGIQRYPKSGRFSLWVSVSHAQDANTTTVFDRIEISYGKQIAISKAGEVAFEACSKVDDPGSEFVPAAPPHAMVSSGTPVDLIHEWRRECREEHSKCQARVSKQTHRPRRLLNVTTHRRGFVQLEEFSSSEIIAYAALSYCWGGRQSLVLTTERLRLRELSFAMESLPQTITDAITTVDDLGMMYIWVDALCIAQDSDLDKATEIGRMGDIYSSAELTIHAATARSCTEGFLDDRDPIAYFEYPVLCPSGEIGTLLLRLDERFWHAWSEPLNERAWTLQERLLSPRNLIYAHQRLVWQCDTIQHSDGGVERFFVHPNTDVGQWRLQALMNPRMTTPLRSEEKVLARRDWLSCLGEYVRRKSSSPGDKLNAIAAIASAYADLTDDQYLAGIWKSTAVCDLAWQVPPFVRRQTSRPIEYRAPSWSWAALDGLLEFTSETLEDLGHARFVAELLDYNVHVKYASSSFGALSFASIRVSGRLMKFYRCQTPPCCRTKLGSFMHIGASYEPETVLIPSLDGFAEPTRCGDAWIDVHTDDAPDSGIIAASDKEPTIIWNGHHDMRVAHTWFLPLYVLYGESVGLLLDRRDDGCFERVGVATKMPSAMIDDQNTIVLTIM
jgi:hypothetical protein